MYHIKYKVLQKHQLNLTNNARFAFKVVKRSKNKRWLIFKKPEISSQNQKLFRVSKYFSFIRLEYKRHRCEHGNVNKYLGNDLNILFGLVESRFVRSLGEASQLIRSGMVSVNGKIITVKNYYLKEGDVVKVHFVLNSSICNTKFYSQFSNISVKTLIPQYLEVSFSIQSFIYCYN